MNSTDPDNADNIFDCANIYNENYASTVIYCNGSLRKNKIAFSAETKLVYIEKTK